ncbi:DUF4440 domain-containing protein [Luteimonas sp. S4-F44]|uniref:nuclear transport factor 2 family protein n=1 Tax=Luteimonas sp. S4-F44 TaxID=2925842 RepID=UPI001F53B7B9|nr:DUF4440 domain-containing protein [Luteimonas sp. S4-F44]UNK43729.1 DUF4440 domain-containing protein [Luteimonas sp. S4-F44]
MTSDVAALLESLERALLDPAVRADRARLDALIADDFTEIGASGAVFGKGDVLDRLPEQVGPVLEAGPMRIHAVTDDVARVAYCITRRDGTDVRRSLRASWWRRDAEGAWRMVFHQGTPDTGAGTI